MYIGSQLQMLDNEIRLHKEKLLEELLPILVGWKNFAFNQRILRKF